MSNMKKVKIEEEEERKRLTQLVSAATNSVAVAEAEAEAIIIIMSSYNHLPEDIMENILSRLPVKSIKRFRCVCKHWYNLFRNPNFINMHHNRGVENENFNLMIREDNHIYSSIDNYCNPSSSCLEMGEINHPFKEENLYDVNIWGTYNGLLCLTATRCYSNEILICIWNPSTKEYKRIPFPSDWSKSEDAHYMGSTYGLGYDCNIGDYKFVFIQSFSYDYDNSNCQVKVFTLGSSNSSWKHIPDDYPYVIRSPGVLVNGTLHWVAFDCSLASEDSRVIVSFDFGAEEFMEVLMPEHLDDNEFLLNDVSALGGCLCIYGTSYDEDCFEVWVMKDYGVRESWTKLFNIAAQQSLGSSRYNMKLIQPFKNDEYLLYIGSNTKDSLVLYNPKKERVRDLNIHYRYLFKAKTYVESLVSLDTGTYVVQERIVELKDYDEKEEK